MKMKKVGILAATVLAVSVGFSGAGFAHDQRTGKIFLTIPPQTEVGEKLQAEQIDRPKQGINQVLMEKVPIKIDRNSDFSLGQAKDKIQKTYFE
jgi:hypothetical protein